MRRKLWTAIVLLGLLATAGSWLTALALRAMSNSAGFTIGASHRTAWLAGALVFPDGEVFLRLFKPNPTGRVGLHVALNSGIRPWTDKTMFGSNGYSSTLRIHLLLPSALFLALSLHAVGWPIARRHWRRRRRRCTGCWYDMRHAPTDTCSECGLNQAPLP